MSETPEEFPLQALSRTKLSETKLRQTISFYYNDPTEIYYSYIKAEIIDELIDEVTQNMQAFLSQDSFQINKQDIPLQIIGTDIDFYKKKRTKPILIFSIVNAKPFELSEKGIQTVLLQTDKEILDYDITSIWKFPGKIQSIESPLNHKINGFNVTFTAKQGMEIGGIEKFTFFYKNKKQKTSSVS